MEGTSSFNGELLEAEHWMVADENTSTKNNDKEKLKASIKQASVNEGIRINAKFGKPIFVKCFRRHTISINDEPEALRVLPNLSSGFDDKLMILHVLPGLPFGPDKELKDYQAWWTNIKEELPAFVHELLNEHVIEAEHSDHRYGVVSFKDPEILNRIQNQSPEARLGEIIDQELFWRRTSLWEGTARDLYRDISTPSMIPELGYIGCTNVNKLGQLMGKLMALRPERFQPTTTVKGILRYRILPPPQPCPQVATEQASPVAEETLQAA